MTVLTSAPQVFPLENVTVSGGQFRFEFPCQTGVTYTVQFKHALDNAAWQNRSTITGDGTRKQVAQPLEPGQGFYPVSAQ